MAQFIEEDMVAFAAPAIGVENQLLVAGRVWTQGEDPDAGVVFRALAEEMIASGEPVQVAETCEQLIGDGARLRVVDALTALSLCAQQRLQPVPPRWHNALGHLTGGS